MSGPETEPVNPFEHLTDEQLEGQFTELDVIYDRTVSEYAELVLETNRRTEAVGTTDSPDDTIRRLRDLARNAPKSVLTLVRDIEDEGEADEGSTYPDGHDDSQPSS